MIAVIDYGMGNLRSVQKALEKIGTEAQITQDKHDIARADKLILPGVGAIQPAVEKLKELQLVGTIKDFVQSGKPFLGICLGLQLLFETSDEGKNAEGLKILPGEVKRFTDLKVPHMGWNQLNIQNKACPLFHGLDSSLNTYFCHSYYVKPKSDDITATTTDYGIDFVSAIQKNNIFGVQFHPEKSQSVGLKILENFVKLSS